MISVAYSQDVEKAKALAYAAHEGALDKSGRPYIGHPARVAERMETDEERVVAWLHDVVEDTDVALERIAAEFGPETAAAVDCISRRGSESWADYLVRVKSNPVARAVKISDLIDNSSLSRLERVTARDVQRQARYNRALFFLMDVD